MKYRYLIVLAAALTGTAFAAFQAPLPEFKNEKQLAALSQPHDWDPGL